jgi:hypothetical protein
MASERRLEGAQEFRDQRLDMLRLHREKTWTLHSADLRREGEVASDTSDRPFTVLDRKRVLTDLGDFRLPAWLFDTPERRLTPRAPYASSPLSYLNAMGRSWSLWAEGDRLEWAELGAPGPRYGGMEFWFRNVTPNSIALVTITADVGATGAGVTGNIEVRSSDAAPRSFPVSGFATHIFDLVVRPDNAWATLVTAQVKSGVGYFGFISVEYQTLA